MVFGSTVDALVDISTKTYAEYIVRVEISGSKNEICLF